MPGLNDGSNAFVPILQVSIEDPPADPTHYEFHRSFRIGRGTDSEIGINNKYVSRIHIEAAFENGVWMVRDLNSSNGMFVDGERVPSVSVARTATIRLGVGGPFVTFTAVARTAPPQPAPVQPVPSWMWEPEPVIPARRPVSPVSSADFHAADIHPADIHKRSVPSDVDRYFRKPKQDEMVGEHTKLVRMAFSQVQKKQQSKWLIVVAVLSLLFLAAVGFAWYEHRQAAEQRAAAESIFYSMKSLDVDIASFQRIAFGNPDLIAQIRTFQNKRNVMEQRYSRYLAMLKMDDSKLSPRQRLSLRVARIFGECELAVPPDFQAEIDRYIAIWKTSNRLENDIATANRNGYTQTIAHELLAMNLPPQFFYLALQESNFDPYANGLKTRMGIAKGMWQFIPDTAIKYGMRVGPLLNEARTDMGDDRHHWEIETKAAARYMNMLYTTDAQASGLLVMACYNWGEDSVLPLVQSLPRNPEERNFWKLLAKHRNKVPKQTYDYVFSIISAAIIGEDPALFGFNFENPLAHIQ